MSVVGSYLAPARETMSEIEVSRSRFLGYLLPVGSEDEARDGVARLRGEHPQARHHCTAFLIGPTGALRRTNDDGEPSGTAGAPMLEALVAAPVSDALAVVVRYFGGVLLGTGGLARAYRRAVSEAIGAAPLLQRSLQAVLEVEVDYADAAALVSLADRSGWRHEADYGETVDLRILLPPAQLERATGQLSAATSGRAAPVARPERWIDLARTRLPETAGPE